MKMIFLGVQGSGKSTQAKSIAGKLNLPYIEMGGILREKRNEDSKDAQIITRALNSGNLVPNEITIRALRERLNRTDCQNGFVLDGYPRNEEQLQALPNDVDKVFYVKISDAEGVKRNLKRGREDDTRELLKKRIDLFHQRTEPILAEFKKRGILEEIDGERTIAEIEDEISEIIKNDKKRN